MKKYLVIEMQTWVDGTMATPTYAYDDKASAIAKWHTILAAAVKSTLPVHAASLMTNDGICLQSECYEHEQPEPEPNEEA